MRVGVPTEIKQDEYRVSMTPAGVRELTAAGHEVFVQAGAGEGSAIADGDYAAQGAQLVADADAVFAAAELIVKVKEPQAVDRAVVDVDLGAEPGRDPGSVLADDTAADHHHPPGGHPGDAAEQQSAAAQRP